MLFCWSRGTTRYPRLWGFFFFFFFLIFFFFPLHATCESFCAGRSC